MSDESTLAALANTTPAAGTGPDGELVGGTIVAERWTIVRFLARGGRVETLEGAWSPGRFVMLEFPSVERAKAWFESAEYAPAKALRHKSAQSHMILVEGV